MKGAIPLRAITIVVWYEALTTEMLSSSAMGL